MSLKNTKMYTKSFQIGLQNAMEYRVNFILSIISTIIPIIVQYFLWQAIYEQAESGVVYGYTYSSMIMYTILAAIISRVVAGTVQWEVYGDIRDGGLNKYIVKPMGYFRYRISCYLGQKSIELSLFALIFIGILSVTSIQGFFRVEGARLGWFIIIIILANILNMLLGFITSVITFWITEAWGAFMILNLVINVASGGVFPLDIFGEKVVKFLGYLPFQYTIYFPINVLNGTIEAERIVSGVCIQLAWILILTFALQIVWKIGLRKYEAVGG